MSEDAAILGVDFIFYYINYFEKVVGLLSSYHVKNLSNQLSWPLVCSIFVRYFLVCHWCSRCFSC